MMLASEGAKQIKTLTIGDRVVYVSVPDGYRVMSAIRSGNCVDWVVRWGEYGAVARLSDQVLLVTPPAMWHELAQQATDQAVRRIRRLDARSAR